MPTPEGIALKIRAGLGLDISEAGPALQSFAQQTQAAVQQSLDQVKVPPPVGFPSDWQRRIQEAHEAHEPASSLRYKTATEQLLEHGRLKLKAQRQTEPMSSTAMAQMRLKEVFGGEFSFTDKQKEIRAIIAEQRLEVSRLEDAYKRMGEAGANVSDKRKQALKTEIEDAKSHRRSLERVFEEGVRREQAAEASQPLGLSDLTQGLSLNQALRGGLVGRGLSRVSSGIMGMPRLAGIAAVAGLGIWGMNRASEGVEPAEDLAIGYQHGARRIGATRSLYPSVSGLGEIGFTPDQVRRLVESYGMPGREKDLLSTFKAIGTVARDAGFGENPEMVAGLARRATQFGIEPGDQQIQFWGMMQRSMTEGVRAGVDKAERMKALFAMMEATAANTGVLSKEMVAGLMATSNTLQEGGRFLSGERGAQTMMGLTESVQTPATIGQEFFQLNAVKAMFGGRMPTAKELGKTGIQARRYEDKGEIEQYRQLMQELPTRPDLFSKFMGQMSIGAPENSQQRMAFEAAIVRMPPMQQEALAEGLARIVDKRRGAGTAQRLPRVDLFSLYEQATQAGGGREVEQLMKEKGPMAGQGELDGLTPQEQARIKEAESQLKWAETKAEATRKYRETRSGLKSLESDLLMPGAKLLNRFSGLFGPGGKDTGVEDKTDRAARALQGRFFRNSYDPSENPDRPGLRARKISYEPDSTESYIRVEVRGKIELTGDHIPEDTTVPASALVPMIEQHLRDRGNRAAIRRPAGRGPLSV